MLSHYIFILLKIFLLSYFLPSDVCGVDNEGLVDLEEFFSCDWWEVIFVVCTSEFWKIVIFLKVP